MVELNLSSVGFVGSGGGFMGRATPSWLKVLIPALLKAGANINYLAGTSVNALNFARLAEAVTDDELGNALNDVDQIWSDIDKVGPECIFPLSVLEVAWGSRHKTSLLDGSTLDAILDGGSRTDSKIKVAKPLDTQRIVNSNRRFDVFVTNRNTREHTAVSNRDHRIQREPRLMRDFIKASASIPPFFPAVTIQGVPYVDGGHFSLSGAINSGCKTIFVLLLYREREFGKPQSALTLFYPWIFEMFLFPAAMVSQIERLEISHAQKDRRDIKIIPLYVKRQPPSVGLDTFRRGDLALFDEMCQEQAVEFVRALGLS